MKRPDLSPIIWQFADGNFVFWTIRILDFNSLIRGIFKGSGKKHVVRLALAKSIVIACREKGITAGHIISPANRNEVNRWRHKYPSKYVIRAPYKLNRARCRNCQDIIESFSIHDFKRCRCGRISVDGGYDCFKRNGSPSDVEELP